MQWLLVMFALVGCGGGADDGLGCESGEVTWTPADGVAQSVTDELPTADADSVEYFLDEPGTLEFCDGSWSVNLRVSSQVEIVGLGEVVLHGDFEGAVIRVEGEGARATVEGLTVTEGKAERLGTYSFGGGVACMDAELVMRDSVITGNLPMSGGAGLATNGCVVVLERVDVVDNGTFEDGETYGEGGGLVIMDSEFLGTSLRIQGNRADDSAAAVFWDNQRDGSWELVDVIVEDNLAMDSVGGIAVGQGELHIASSSPGASRFHRNGLDPASASVVEDAAALHLWDGGVVVDGVDFGATGSVDDNEGPDVWAEDSDKRYAADQSATFTCGRGGACEGTGIESL